MNEIKQFFLKNKNYSNNHNNYRILMNPFKDKVRITTKIETSSIRIFKMIIFKRIKSNKMYNKM
jgi:hypothetical protein